jgi:hypothetical protein
MNDFQWFGLIALVFLFSHSIAQTLPIPYFTDFENGSMGWTIDAQSEWQLTSPNSYYFTDAYSGDSAFVTNGNSPYSNNTTSFLYSPTFDIAGQGPFEISFWHNYNTESTWDGCRVDMNLDGDGWIPLIDNPNAVNWHSNDVIQSSGYYGWSGNSNDWENSSMRFFTFGSYQTIQFRFVLSADPSINIENGWAMDDFRVAPLNISVSENSDLNVRVFPNPAQRYLYISGADVSLQDWKIINGRGEPQHVEWSREDLGNEPCYKIDVSNWSQGIYHLVCTEKKFSSSFIILR